MKSVTPDHRYREVLALVEAKGACPAGKHEADLYQLLTGQAHSVAVERAHDIYTHEFKQETLEAVLLVDFEPDEIQEILQVPIAVTEIYAYLFFDASSFLDELDRTDYAYTYAKSLFGKELKRSAIELGKECLKVRLSKGSHIVDPVTVQNSVRTTAFMMASLVRINQVDSALANAALRWAQVALKAVENDDGIDESSAFERLKMTLQTREDATNEEQSGIPASEILH